MATRTGKRDMEWRDDKPATLVWAEALDNGDPDIKVKYRDAVSQLNATFNNSPKLILKTLQRFAGIDWGNDDLAIGTDYSWNTRNTKTYLFNPSDANSEANVISDRSYQDVYSDPGPFVTSKNEFGRNTLAIQGNKIFLMGDGFTEKGQFPFVDEYNVKTNKKKRLYQSKYKDKLETLSSAINMKDGEILVRLESQTEYPNYHIRNIKKKSITAITAFDNPFKSLEDVNKRVISYKRNDGLDLEGTLYLPLNYEKGKKYPLILWAYPREL
jgi:dipeptidyl aminopeptidase/acylaminoacyl peptidase